MSSATQTPANGPTYAAVAASADSTTTASITKLTDASPTLSHLKQYPLISQSVSYVSGITIVQSLQKFIEGSVLVYAAALLGNFQFLKSILLSADRFINDTFLVNLDKFAPGLTSLTWKDLYPSVIFSYVYLQVSAFVSQHTGSITNKLNDNREAISAKVDPIISPVNRTLSGYLDKYLPGDGATDASTSEGKDELAKFSELATTAYTRAVPIATKTAQDLQAVPANVQAHVSKIYKNQLQNDPNTSRAFAKTSIELTNEISSHIRPVFDPLVTRVESIAKSTQSKVNDVVENTKSNVDSIVSQVRSGVDRGNNANVSSPVAIGAA
ncbi:hypothetical protein BABINDRAFT_162177 [Babjeviella inositovora NRRL Y-12698]|uniref:Uncharacterized protein n=1 Tax=Babjeviella inositovora NRRL Y-12698 TaxID=984486 RepID=A0A1E3QNU3_9ASCO|nr:uncharacterized protein BABINDRAFT_162177 [Babjeviella inositovora NRRL Y-12698]ODQ79114.1 hypothetical protein BABINDRAFT_162177 [Babjeviella inositovora NRRL Y-12698]